MRAITTPEERWASRALRREGGGLTETLKKSEGLSEGTGKTGEGKREQEAEDKKQGRAGRPHKLTAQMGKAGQGFPNNPLCGLSAGVSILGCNSEESSPMDTLFIQASVSPAEVPRAAD